MEDRYDVDSIKGYSQGYFFAIVLNDFYNELGWMREILISLQVTADEEEPNDDAVRIYIKRLFDRHQDLLTITKALATFRDLHPDDQED